eukprot:5116013-Pyramimonas_sp.AAC.1
MFGTNPGSFGRELPCAVEERVFERLILSDIEQQPEPDDNAPTEDIQLYRETRHHAKTMVEHGADGPLNKITGLPKRDRSYTLFSRILNPDSHYGMVFW